MALLDYLISGTGDARRTEDPFPKDAQGRLTNPSAVATEGTRIRESLAAGQYGNQPVATGGDGVTPAPADAEYQRKFGDSFFNQPSMWQQNEDNPGLLRQNLRLDELRTTAAARKFELERAQKEAPLQNAFLKAKLEHQQAATAAIGATNMRQIQKDASSMKAVANFEKAMLSAGEPGTPEYEKNVRQAISDNPAILSTKFGAEHIPNLNKEHEQAMKAKALSVKTEVSDFKGTYGFPKSALAASTVKVVNVDPNDPKKVTGADNGTHVLVTTPTGKTVLMTTEAYEANGGKYSDKTQRARGGSQPTDRKELARKALNDPNASEAHRAAARKILTEQ